MISRLIFVLGLVMFFSCSDDIEPPTIWGIHYSAPETQLLAAGLIDQHAEGRATYAVDRAYVKHISGDDYKLIYKFSSADSITLLITKKATDFSFNYPATAEGNELKEALFNGNKLNLSESVIVIEPRTSENKFRTSVRLYSEAGFFDGAVSSIPLLK